MAKHQWTALTTATAATCLLLAGCELLKGNPEVQGVIDRRVLGMSAGTFFDRYGPAYGRRELVDASTDYEWASQVGFAAPGPEGLDDRVCKLRLSADKAGRISTVVVVLDAPGRVSTSRCSEIFGNGPGPAPDPRTTIEPPR